MREIKFRAWDTRHKEWLGAEAWYVSPDGSDWVYIWNDEKQQFISYDPVVLMQYTGLKTNNGTEVYESDIVKLSITWGYPDEEDINNSETWDIREVKFVDGSFAPIINGDAGYVIVEVLGNIYENPELLSNS